MSFETDSSSEEERQVEEQAQPQQQETSSSPEVLDDEMQVSPEETTPSLRLPTEVQYETNGGPLGCCMGVVAGIFLTALIITGISLLTANGAFFGAATLPVFILGAIVCGFLGWKIGKRVYREYEMSPRQKRKMEQLEKRYQQANRQ